MLWQNVRMRASYMQPRPKLWHWSDLWSVELGRTGLNNNNNSSYSSSRGYTDLLFFLICPFLFLYILHIYICVLCFQMLVDLVTVLWYKDRTNGTRPLNWTQTEQPYPKMVFVRWKSEVTDHWPLTTGQQCTCWYNHHHCLTNLLVMLWNGITFVWICTNMISDIQSETSHLVIIVSGHCSCVEMVYVWIFMRTGPNIMAKVSSMNNNKFLFFAFNTGYVKKWFIY